MANLVLPELLTVPEVAQHLRVSVTTVKRLIRVGRLRPTRIGRRTLVTSRELAAYVAHAEGRGRVR